jgi:RNA polymerase sigma factor (sigma-70 family)
MMDKVASHVLIWDFVIPEPIAESQQWVLSSMQKHGPELVKMLWRILGNEQDVCDAYQDTFLRLAHYEGGQKPNKVKAYLFRSASNVAVSMLRHRMAEKRLSTAIVESNHIKQCINTTNELDSKLLRETLMRHLARLPKHLRNVIILHDLAELSYGQVGRILGVTTTTTRVYRCKAIQLLSIWMNEEDNERQ